MISAVLDTNVLVATAQSAKADYLVTGDKKLLKLRSHGNIPIISPRQFLDILKQLTSLT